METLSKLAHTLIPSEIIKLGNEINERIRQGQAIHNFTIGDFDPAIFPIPQGFEDAIVNAYRSKQTNYPPANGIAACREAVAGFIAQHQGLDYAPSSFLISGGGRPLIYAAYRSVCDRGESIIYPVPSWNNNHYTHFVEGDHICINTSPETRFMPTLSELQPYLEKACLLALCSPLNPTGTVFSRDQLKAIAEAVLQENRKREGKRKPLYILYDQIYWTLTFGETRHENPVSLVPELRPYTIFIDGMSKAFCATGVRVGWAFGPEMMIDKMKGILSHIGAWSPMAEQVATANYLSRKEEVVQDLSNIRHALFQRLNALYQGIMALKDAGYPVDAIAPEAAMYLTLRFSLKGKQYDDITIEQTADITAFLLNKASLALVPFAAFGADKESEWYRLSVGTCKLEAIPLVLAQLKEALDCCR